MFVGDMPGPTSLGDTCPDNDFSDSGSTSWVSDGPSSGELGWSTGFCGYTGPVECDAYSGYDDWVCSLLDDDESFVSVPCLSKQLEVLSRWR